MGRTSNNRRTRRANAWIALLAAVPLAGCGAREAAREPAGAWWAGRGPAVRELLAQVAALEGTPLARRAREIAAALPECEVVGAHAPDGDLAGLAAGARCLGAGDPLEAIRRASASDLVFQLARAEGSAVRGAARFHDGALGIDLRWPDPPADGVLGLLVPGAVPAGPDRLAGAGRLAALRVRPRAGLDLAALAPDGSQADQLFRLESVVLAGAVLDGTWEGAVYLPERADAMPAIAVAIGFSVRSAAVAAMERLVTDLSKTWPVHRSELRLPAGDGACLLDLNVLPELAPCYVATADALVVGWNRAALARALAAPALGAPDVPARLDLDLARIQHVDELIAGALTDAQPPLRWPWSRVLATAAEEGGAIAVHVTLVPHPESAS